MCHHWNLDCFGSNPCLPKDVLLTASNPAMNNTLRAHWLPREGEGGSLGDQELKICFDLMVIDLSPNFMRH